jgi:hypothetical protein
LADDVEEGGPVPFAKTGLGVEDALEPRGGVFDISAVAGFETCTETEAVLVLADVVEPFCFVVVEIGIRLAVGDEDADVAPFDVDGEADLRALPPASALDLAGGPFALGDWMDEGRCFVLDRGDELVFAASPAGLRGVMPPSPLTIPSFFCTIGVVVSASSFRLFTSSFPSASCSTT